MRAPVKWLKEYVEFDETPEDLGERLTRAGIPLESIDRPGTSLTHVVTGLVKEVNPHPNADRLFVCRIDVGGRIVTIVTGANNIRAGQIVPVALSGAELASGTVIGETNFRGILSEGMLCSAEELLGDTKLISPDKRDGIYILPFGTPIGQDIRPIMGLDETTMEFELTANRADCFSVLGIAREIGVLTNHRVKRPMLPLKESGDGKASSMATVEILEPGLCSRFSARILTNVRIGESPVWMQQRLQAAGMRPINNIVDVTNFVMLEQGQPMHAYDYNLLSRHSIIVRRANLDERLTTLDGVKRPLTPNMLVIADAVQPVGIAGVMGGLATEVSSATRTVLLEAASFNGPSIRRTSRGLGLRSEASGRFERGVDIAAIPLTLDRAAQLLEGMGACEVVPGIIDVYPGIALPAQFKFTPTWINTYLGSDISSETMVDILQRLDFKIAVEADGILITAPSWRQDVTGPADIAEEVARIYGYDNIQSTTPEGPLHTGSQKYGGQLTDKVRSILTGLGFYETLSFSFSHPDVFDRLHLPANSPLREAIPLMNPITDEFPILRTSLTPGLLETVARNLARKNDDLRLYELGATYHPHALPVNRHPLEPLRVSGALVGRREGNEWCHLRENVDFYDAKGIVESLLKSVGLDSWTLAATRNPSFHPGKSADVIKEEQIIATFGLLHPSVQESFGLAKDVYLFEIDLSLLQSLDPNSFSPHCALPRFPAITRDLAFVISADIAAGEVMQEVERAGKPLLVESRLFDVYSGSHLEPGTRSLAFTLVFRSAERTLTDKEVEVPVKAVVDTLAKKYGAVLRS